MAVNAHAIINGVNYSGSIATINRTWSLKRVAQSFDVFLRPTVDYSGINPGQAVQIYEQGSLVLTGLVDGREVSRDSPRILVFGRDRFKLAQDYFVTEDLLSSGSQSAGYWVDYFCNLVGLTYGILGTSGSPILSEDVPLQRRFVSEILEDICGRVGWQMRVATSGSLQFLSILATGTMDYNFTSQLKGGQVTISDQDTRNKFHVWGWSPTSGSPIRVVSERAVAGLPALPKRVGVFALPHIRTVAQASALAEAALDQFASLERVGKASLIGNPAIIPGQFGEMTVLGQRVASAITDVSSENDEAGQRMSLMIGRRNPRLPKWPVGASSGSMTFIWDGDTSIPNYLTDCVMMGGYLWACGILYNFPATGRLVRIDPADGSVLDNFTFSNWRPWSITTDGTYLYVGGSINNDAQVMKVSSSGSVIWSNRVDVSGGIFSAGVTEVVYANGYVYSCGYGLDARSVIEKRATDGTQAWFRRESPIPSGARLGSMAIIGSTIFFACYHTDPVSAVDQDGIIRLTDNGSSVSAVDADDIGGISFLSDSTDLIYDGSELKLLYGNNLISRVYDTSTTWSLSRTRESATFGLAGAAREKMVLDDGFLRIAHRSVWVVKSNGASQFTDVTMTRRAYFGAAVGDGAVLFAGGYDSGAGAQWRASGSVYSTRRYNKV